MFKGIFNKLRKSTKSPTICRDLWPHIFSYCRDREIIQLSRVCKYFNTLARQYADSLISSINTEPYNLFILRSDTRVILTYHPELVSIHVFVRFNPKKLDYCSDKTKLRLLTIIILNKIDRLSCYRWTGTDTILWKIIRGQKLDKLPRMWEFSWKLILYYLVVFEYVDDFIKISREFVMYSSQIKIERYITRLYEITNPQIQLFIASYSRFLSHKNDT